MEIQISPIEVPGDIIGPASRGIVLYSLLKQTA